MPMPVALMYMRLPPSYMSYPPSLMDVPLVPSANPYRFGRELMMLDAELTNKVTVVGNGSVTVGDEVVGEMVGDVGDVVGDVVGEVGEKDVGDRDPGRVSELQYVHQALWVE
mmetsp:Transcript_23316/g.44516  ORF Transcript_23316/g.44516 Transcript_23316/m.44516 type:complete len:112 (+) Transcript_23316:276-611(+)